MARKKVNLEEAKTAVIPHDPVNEQVIIAAALADKATRKTLVDKIKTDSLQVPSHKVIWAAITELVRKDLDLDLATLQQLSAGQIDGEYITVLMESRPEVPPNLLFHVECLFWDEARVKAATGPVAALLEALRNPTESPERVKALARQVPSVFDGYQDRRFMRDNNDVIRNMMTELRKRREGQAIHPFGIKGLDFYEDGKTPRLIPGAAPGKITVISGLSGTGKSTLIKHLALGLARKRKKILWGVWEEDAEISLESLAAFSLGMSRGDLRLGDYTDEDLERIEEVAHKISPYVQFMDNPFFQVGGKGRPSNERNLELIHSYIKDSGCDVFIADLWRKCLADIRPEAEELALNHQQWIAKETKVHAILVQQLLLKDVEKRPDKRPTREAIKGSGAWTEVADNILGVHRPALWKRVPETMEVLVLKQRFGRWPQGVSFDHDSQTGHLVGGVTIEFDALSGMDTQEEEPGAAKPLSRFKHPGNHGKASGR